MWYILIFKGTPLSLINDYGEQCQEEFYLADSSLCVFRILGVESNLVNGTG